MSQKLKELEKKIGYTFQDLEILKQAMMHSSYIRILRGCSVRIGIQ